MVCRFQQVKEGGDKHSLSSALYVMIRVKRETIRFIRQCIRVTEIFLFSENLLYTSYGLDIIAIIDKKNQYL